MRITNAFIAIGMSLAVSACGGDDDSSSNGTGGASSGGSGGSSGSGGSGGSGAKGGSGGSTGGKGGTSGSGATGGSGGVAGTPSGGGSGGSGGSSSPEKRVFLSSQKFTGKLGGLVGADSECQNLANSANLAGSFIAWLSDGTASPSSRFDQSAGPYVRLDNTHIAETWADLTDSSINAPINIDEKGQQLAAGADTIVWTATAAGGTSTGMHCTAWTATDQFSPTGRADKIDTEWTLSTGINCTELHHLYCFEK